MQRRRLEKAFIFLLRLLLLAVPFHLAIGYANLFFLQEITAKHVHAILTLFGAEVQLNGAMLRFDGFDVLVSRDSTGWKSAFFLAALVLASHASPREKSVGIFTFVPAVYAINLFRVAMTAYSASYGVIIFNILHDLLWQLGMAVAVLALWAIWLRKRTRLSALVLMPRTAHRGRRTIL